MSLTYLFRGDNSRSFLIQLYLFTLIFPPVANAIASSRSFLISSSISFLIICFRSALGRGKLISVAVSIARLSALMKIRFAASEAAGVAAAGLRGRSRHEHRIRRKTKWHI